MKTKKSLFAILALISAVMLFLPVSAAFGQSTLRIVPGTDLAKLLKSGPTIVSSEVDSTSDDWTKCVTDVHWVTTASIEKVAAVLDDLKNQPNVFKGSITSTAKVVIDSVTPEGTTVTTTTKTSLGPINDETTYTTLITKQDNLPKYFSRIIKQIGENNKIRKVSSTWYIETVTVDGKPCTYIRFYDNNEVNQNGLKRIAIKGGIKGAHQDTLKQLVKAASG
ncbi:MAG: hypothetical protein LBV52_04075 [Spirochaetaceae bacterium]|jgi:hypothetical protein|nr:hypothetical protein [Spirochaetaceae bacterium]